MSPAEYKTLPVKIFLVRIGRTSCGVIVASTERRSSPRKASDLRARRSAPILQVPCPQASVIHVFGVQSHGGQIRGFSW